MAKEETIYILDRITSKPGRGKELFEYYSEHYVPVAKRLGMTHEHSWVNPPLWMEGEQSNTLIFVWSVKGVAGYWASVGAARWDATTSHFWRDLEPLMITRTRSVAAEASDIESLAHV